MEAIRHSFGNTDLLTYHPDPRGNLEARKKFKNITNRKE
ncbi:hypothetical protein LEP1GSC133_0556 [Leptospira borgpetersenii serovar Pomona str. 200901868]|uniref:Uncharacterized protein n=1 Tax=Leptospira borgpetersenii serovar Pomona str. 200901868 TaxID=1192866 RepID=M6W2J1_LEPBO|nr:hypothetical protein LEP1GSC133_0556 [Leptospira borgpetersenii serovar Pomona str. 200901868]